MSLKVSTNFSDFLDFQQNFKKVRHLSGNSDEIQHAFFASFLFILSIFEQFLTYFLIFSVLKMKKFSNFPFVFSNFNKISVIQMLSMKLRQKSAIFD